MENSERVAWEEHWNDQQVLFAAAFSAGLAIAITHEVNVNEVGGFDFAWFWGME